MRKLLVLVLISVLVFGCKKDEQTAPTSNEQEISFAPILIDPGATGMKDTWDCINEEPDYAEVEIFDGTDYTTYFPLVYRIDGVLYTQNIKIVLPTGISQKNYWVTKFILWDDGDTPGGTLPDWDSENPAPNGDDQIVMGTPAQGADFSLYVSTPLDLMFEITAFNKIEIPIDVLCYQKMYYKEFGFFWFDITEIVIREQCFFGDLCVKHPDDYLASLYGTAQPPIGQTALDMPAIFYVEVYIWDDVAQEWDELAYSPFTNADAAHNYGAGVPLCIQYPDDLSKVDDFMAKLFILVKWGDTFVYKEFPTDWVWSDDGIIPNGTDGIVEFVLGECNLTGTDLQLAPYQDLPTMANLTIDAPGNPGYWDLYINTMTPAGSYDIVLNPYGVDPQIPGFCADFGTYLGSWPYPNTIDFYVYPSLYDETWPSTMPWTITDIAKVNWLMNNLDLYGMSFETLDQADGLILQDAIWNLLNGQTNGGTAGTMSSDAMYHGDFVPLPGGWAAVIFIQDAEPETYQVIFTVVDP